MNPCNPNQESNGTPFRQPEKGWSTGRDSSWLGLLTALFGLRVGGQAVQHWLPQSYLPPFGAFQGSRLPYPILLLSQLTILSLMVRVCGRARRGALRPSAATARVLGWAGAWYMAGSLLRITVGVAVPSASAWFRAWIPGMFHLILAAFVLCLARAYRQAQPSISMEVRR